MLDEAARPLRDLVRALPGAELPEAGEGVLIRGIAADSRQVRPGHLFVAAPGSRADGRAFIDEALARGAAAVVAESPVGELGVPVVRVSHARRALARLAAAWYDRPAERLSLVGITGSLGKTSVLTMLEAILDAAGMRIGGIGSLGARTGERTVWTDLTTPDPLVLHRLLAEIADRGAGLAAMEVTSHALAQERIHGLEFALGIFTNLVLLEHRDYHGSFRRYVETKLGFFDHLRPGASLVYPADDRLLRVLVRGRAVVPVGCGPGRRAVLRAHARGLGLEGTHLLFVLRRPLPCLDGRPLAPVAFPVRLRLLGRSHVRNATLAAAAALCLGVGVRAVRTALAALPSPRRRMEVIWRGRFTILDDTVGHPDSISAVFELARTLPHARMHAAYAIRGRRGVEINRRDAEAIAVWAAKGALETLVVTSSEGADDEANRVESDERDTFLGVLHRYGVAHEYRKRLDDAVRTVLERAAQGDLVLLLGAQGMNAGAGIARRWLGEHG